MICPERFADYKPTFEDKFLGAEITGLNDELLKLVLGPQNHIDTGLNDPLIRINYYWEHARRPHFNRVRGT